VLRCVVSIVVLTGRPGVGKTTLFLKVVNEIRRAGIGVFGFYCPEVRDPTLRRRIGFRIVDLRTSNETWLAVDETLATKLNFKVSRVGLPRIGRYLVLIDEASKLMFQAIKRLSEQEKILAIDEVGPMELAVPGFREALMQSLNDVKVGLLVVHRNIDVKAILGNVIENRNLRVFLVNEDNRDVLHTHVLQEIFKVLSH